MLKIIYLLFMAAFKSFLHSWQFVTSFMRQKTKTFEMIFRAINPLVPRDLQNVSNETMTGSLKYVMWLVPLTLTRTFMLNSPDTTWNFFTLCHPNTHYNSSLIVTSPNGLIWRCQRCSPFANLLMQIDIYRRQNWKQKKPWQKRTNFAKLLLFWAERLRYTENLLRKENMPKKKNPQKLL